MDIKTLADRLRSLALNLQWSWEPSLRGVFNYASPELWDQSQGNPLLVLSGVGQARLGQLAEDAVFLRMLEQATAISNEYMASERPRAKRMQNSPLRSVAYFSPEFGVCEALPQYSGGLGILAGDHLKASSDLDLPLIGIGLFYRKGYFKQRLSQQGWQSEEATILDMADMPLELVAGARVALDYPDGTLMAQVWKAQVGRVPLYLLDADLPENSPEQREISDQLYSGDQEHRIRQEILLGIGGFKAIEALKETPQIFHLNEGHAGFLALERIRDAVTRCGKSLDEAIAHIRSSSAFTTHTPVPAGIDVFPRSLMEKYFAKLAAECGLSIDRLMALGHEPGQAAGDGFNMAVMCLNLAGRAGGVSRLHGAVSRSMFHRLWPDLPADDVPISSVTNGVHAKSWVSDEMRDLFHQIMGAAWDAATPAEWTKIEEVADQDVWKLKAVGRSKLTAMVNAANSASRLQESVLTIGFARRFAEYKRANLLFSQPDRLVRLLDDESAPIQIVLAGKAHPADEPGKRLMHEIIDFSKDPRTKGRVSFVADYDIGVAKVILQGVDVWLNNPLRPLEACGTSGQKAALNGALNLSIKDGWWDEMFDGANGWSIDSNEAEGELQRRNADEADSLFGLLENEVIPMFYDRPAEGPPSQWVAMIKHSLAVLGPKVNAYRMLGDYVGGLYEPLAAQIHTPR